MLTYPVFLLLFLLPPTVVVILLLWRDRKRGVHMPVALRSLPASALIALHMAIAFVYTYPWDSYLIATRVWEYPPGSVLFRVGLIPIEECIFFVVQSFIAGAWLVFLSSRIPAPREPFVPRPALRWGVSIALLAVWLVSAGVLLGPYPHMNYLALIFVWALPPLILQCAFGADIAWRYRWLIGACIASNTLYWGVADTVAIGHNTWTIRPEQSTQIMVWGPLPLEELVFFLVTTWLLVSGITLGISQEAQGRFRSWVRIHRILGLRARS